MIFRCALFTLVFTAVFLLVFTTFETGGPSVAEAAYKAKGKCASALRKWRRSPGNAAFALSRNGNACGWTTGYPSRKSAGRDAVRKCRELGKRCKVVASIKAKPLPRLRGACLKNFRNWRRQDGYGAFALAKDGTFCNAVWEADSEAGARDQALQGCKAKSGCTIYQTSLPDDLEKARQRQLKALGFYKGEIDGAWGRGSRAALSAFEKAVGADKDVNTTYQLLKWATLINRQYDVTPEVAIANAKEAFAKGNTDFMSAKAKPLSPVTRSEETAEGEGEGEVAEPAKPDPELVSTLNLQEGGNYRGPGNWQYSSTSRNAPNVSLIGRCRLTSDGIGFVYFGGNQTSVAVLLEEGKIGSDDGEIEWVFKDLSRLRMAVRNRTGLGAHVPISNPVAFLNVLSKEDKLQIRTTAGLLEFDAKKLAPMARAFTDCIAATLREPLEAPKAAPKPKTTGEAVATRNTNGQFLFLLELNALPVRALFDTGASFLTINESVAKQLGIRLDDADFKNLTITANGQTKYAAAQIKEVRVGGITLNDVDVAVLRDTSLSKTALLGMSFLGRLKRFEFEGDQVKLTQ